jgi:dipeptidyl aminopeptidase/acylaminoacyl peptidase
VLYAPRRTGRAAGASRIWRAARRQSGRAAHQRADGETGPRWSPDGRTIAFAAKRGDNEFAQIYLLPVDGGEARQLTTHASSVSELSWTPDGAAIYFKAPEAKSAEQKARERARDDVYAYDENYQQTHLWKVTVGSGAEARITDGDFSVTGYDLSADGRRMTYLRAPTPLLGDGDRSEVWIANADGTNAVQLTRNTVQETNAAISPDNASVLFVSGSNAQFETYYNGRLFVVPAAGGAARAIVGESEPIDVDSAVWSSDGRSIYFFANLGVHEELFVVPAAGGKPRTDRRQAQPRCLVARGQPDGVHAQRLDQQQRSDDAGRGRDRAEGGHARVRRSREDVRARTAGGDHLEGRGRRHRRRDRHLSGGLSGGAEVPARGDDPRRAAGRR